MIGAVIAMQSEAEILLKQMKVERTLRISGKDVYVGTAFGKSIALCRCGIGKVNAALGAQLLVSKFDVDTLLNFGVAGGLNAATELCAVYQIGQATQFDFDLADLNGTSIGTLNEYTERYLPLSVVDLPFAVKKLATADRFNDSQTDYKLLVEEMSADIRDMEGGAVVQAALAMELPVYIFKAISDVAGSGNTTEQYLVNRDKALVNLGAALPQIFEKL